LGELGQKKLMFIKNRKKINEFIKFEKKKTKSQKVSIFGIH